MTEVLLQQIANMTSFSSPSESSSILGKFFRPSTMSGRLGNIYAGMCQELEPEAPHGLPVETWNASLSPEMIRQKYRSDCDSNITSRPSTPAKLPEIDIPRWSWPNNSTSTASHEPISRPLNPSLIS